MAPHYQAATLIAAPSYPNSITWSSENLVAVASGHIVTILNPAAIEGPRGFVLLHPRDPFPIGVVKREDLLEPCLVPTFLVRDTEPCARSISWSRQGFAPNSGCLLAVCTVDGHVNLYRSPIWEFCDEWVEVADVSKLLFNYYKSINFGEDDTPDSIPQEKANSEQTHEMVCAGELQGPLSCSDLGRRKRKPSSVKIWSGNTEGLNQCTYVKELPFSLLAEVTTNSSAPVSSVSLSVPAQPQHGVSFNLAIGRVSGSLETWMWDPCRNKIENTSACHAHDQVVTGLSWGLDGHCLYSCSQDNSAHCWIFEKQKLEEIPVLTNFQELNESTDLSEVSDQCFGLTIAPGQLMIAVVRTLDPSLLDQMYQARTQKAVVEFIWIGGQFLGLPLDKGIHICSPQSGTNLLWWGSNIFWSLKKYENGERGLALWDT